MSSIKKEYPNRIEYQNEKGQCHREDGPAIEWNIGDKSWWINGKRHREDGPAVETTSGRKFWYLNDKNYSEDDYYQEVTKIKLKRILDL
jgi:hypothetical protein